MYENFKENLLDKCNQRLIGRKQLLAEKLAEVKKLREEIAEVEALSKSLKETKTNV